MRVNVRRISRHRCPVNKMFALVYGRDGSVNVHRSVVPRINRLGDLIVPARRHWPIVRICDKPAPRTAGISMAQITLRISTLSPAQMDKAAHPLTR